MRIQTRHADSGIALIIVLLVIVVLGLLAAGFAYSMKVETKLARNANHDAELEWLGRSGIELARYVLAQEGTGPWGQYDSLMHKWAGGPGDSNSVASAIPLENYQLGSGSFSVKIVDLDRKLNINVAATDENILKHALSLIGVEGAERDGIAGAIMDWCDRDDSTHVGGAESNDYETNPNPGYPPYTCKNGPIDDLTELLLIKGVTPAMYWGSGGGHAPLPRRRISGNQSPFEEVTYAVGMVDIFTPLSSRQININTASASTLQIFPGIDENIAAMIMGPQGRAGMDGAEGTVDDTPFRSPGDLARVLGPNAAMLQQFMQYFTVRSLIFEVRVQAKIDNVQREYVALLRRSNPRDIQVLNMYWR
jgi:general secretion pathway protein K